MARGWFSGMLGAEGAGMGEHDESGEEPWPFFRYPRAHSHPGLTSRDDARGPRGAGREQQIAKHVQRHRERGAQPPRRDRGLSRSEIVRTAIALADAEGPDAISMRRIARELGAGVMSLYWYVGSKEELLDLMLDMLEAEIELPEPSGDWRADMRETAYRIRAGMSRHRWALEFLGGRPPAGPNDVRNLERLLGMLHGLDLDARVTMDILGVVTTYVTGAVIREAQELRSQRDQELAEANMTEQEKQEQHERFRKWLQGAGRYPRIAELAESGLDPDDPATRDERFDFGLNCLLDGVAAQLPR
jgi:AcrR family transcriptional regulator